MLGWILGLLDQDISQRQKLYGLSHPFALRNILEAPWEMYFVEGDTLLLQTNLETSTANQLNEN